MKLCRSQAVPTLLFGFSRSLKSVAAQESKMAMSAGCPPMSAVVRGDAPGRQCPRLLQLQIQLKSHRMSAGVPPVNVRGSTQKSYKSRRRGVSASSRCVVSSMAVCSQEVSGKFVWGSCLSHTSFRRIRSRSVAPDHTGRIQRLRDTLAKNLRSLAQPQRLCGQHPDLRRAHLRLQSQEDVGGGERSEFPRHAPDVGRAQRPAPRFR